MYTNLEYNRQSFTTDIYDYIPTQAYETIIINKEYKIDQLCSYEPEVKSLIETVPNNISYPVVICKSIDNKNALIIKAKKNESENITNHIKNNISLSYPPLIKNYKDKSIQIYNLSGDNFLIYTIHKGIIIISNSYQLTQDILDTDPENTFFSNDIYAQEIKDIREKSNIAIFFKHNQNLFAFDYNTANDTICLEGHLLLKNEADSMLFRKENMLSILNIPDSLCSSFSNSISGYTPPLIQIKLNKMY
jgi:hypothetical protein